MKEPKSEFNLDDIHHPENLCCPITGELFEDPVSIIVDGVVRTYERSAITTWLEKKKIDPTTNKPVDITDEEINQLPRNVEMASAVADYRSNLEKQYEAAKQAALAAEKLAAMETRLAERESQLMAREAALEANKQATLTAEQLAEREAQLAIRESALEAEIQHGSESNSDSEAHVPPLQPVAKSSPAKPKQEVVVYFTPLQFHDYKKDHEKASLAIADREVSKQFSGDQLVTLAKLDRSLAIQIATDERFRDRLNKVARKTIINHHKLYDDVVRRPQAYGLEYRDIVEYCFTLRHGLLSAVTLAAIETCFKAILLDQDAWPQLDNLQWQAIFSHRNVRQTLIDSIGNENGIIYQLDSEQLLYLYRGLVSSGGLGFHQAADTKLLRSFVTDVKLISKIPVAKLFKATSLPDYIQVLLEQPHIVENLPAGALLLCCANIQGRHDRLDAQQEHPVLLRIGELLATSELTQSHIYRFYKCLPDAPLRAESDVEALCQLELNHILELTCCSAACSEVFRQHPEVYKGISYEQAVSIQKIQPMIVTDALVAELRASALEARVHEIMRDISGQNSPWKKNVRISQFATEGGEMTVSALMASGCWRNSAKPHVILLICAGKYDSVFEWIAKNIDLNTVKGLQEYAQDNPEKQEIYQRLLTDNRRFFNAGQHVNNDNNHAFIADMERKCLVM